MLIRLARRDLPRAVGRWNTPSFSHNGGNGGLKGCSQVPALRHSKRRRCRESFALGGDGKIADCFQQSDRLDAKCLAILLILMEGGQRCFTNGIEPSAYRLQGSSYVPKVRLEASAKSDQPCILPNFVVYTLCASINDQDKDSSFAYVDNSYNIVKI